MQVLLDECLPRPLHRYFKAAGLDFKSVHELGWDGKQNGELIALMNSMGFELLITIDQNLQYQQNLASAGIALITIKAKSNRVDDLLPAIPKVISAIPGLSLGQQLEISA